MGLAWSRRLETTTTSKALAISIDACVCLSAWNETRGKLSETQVLRKRQLTLSVSWESHAAR
jgi:hypothetical protein